MAKRASLLGIDPTPAEKTTSETIPVPEPAKPQRVLPPGRQGRKALTIWTTDDAIRQLKQIALNDRTTMEQIVRGLLNGFFAEKGFSRIA